MRDFILQDFEEFFYDLVENSFFDMEKKDFFSALETLNISKEELIMFFSEINDLTTQINGEIEITLKDLPKSIIFNKIISLIETGEIKYVNATEKLRKYLDSAVVIFMQELEKIDEVQFETSKTNLNNNKQLLRERFNYDDTEKNNLIIIEKYFKGQQSLLLKNELKPNKFIPILQKLKTNGLISFKTTNDNFEKIFLGISISKENKIDWTGTKYELLLFLKALKPKLRVIDYIYDSAIRCFTINGKAITKTSEISNASGKSAKKQIIEDIALLF
jgi:hypothetical protein